MSYSDPMYRPKNQNPFFNPTAFQPAPQSVTPTFNAQPQQQQVKSDVAAGADFMPYMNQLQDLLRDPNKIKETGAYKFRQDQQNQAINRSAAAKGMLGSGNVLAELAKYSGNLASQEYDTQTNRLSDLMRQSQQFGLASDYYKPPQPEDGWQGGSYVSYNKQPSWY